MTNRMLKMVKIKIELQLNEDIKIEMDNNNIEII